MFALGHAGLQIFPGPLKSPCTAHHCVAGWDIFVNFTTSRAPSKAMHFKCLGPFLVPPAKFPLQVLFFVGHCLGPHYVERGWAPDIGPGPANTNLALLGCSEPGHSSGFLPHSLSRALHVGKQPEGGTRALNFMPPPGVWYCVGREIFPLPWLQANTTPDSEKNKSFKILN